MRRAIKGIIYLILAFIALYIFYATFKIVTGKHIVVPILGDINPIEKNTDTITNTVFIHDTAYLFKNDSGASSLQNFGPNYGDQAGRDIVKNEFKSVDFNTKTFIADGKQQIFILPAEAADSNKLFVSALGVLYRYGEEYKITGNKLILSYLLPEGTHLTIRWSK